MSPQQIAHAFNLTLGEVHAALAYYYDHQLEIDRSITESDRRAQDLAAKYPQGWSAEPAASQTPRIPDERRHAGEHARPTFPVRARIS